MLTFYNIKESSDKLIKIHYSDIYFTPKYGEACEYSDNATWELCQYKDLIYVYLKKEYIFENTKYYDLLTPYGYSGYYFEKQETYDEFLPIFKNEAKKKNYLTEVVRQNPYININLNYDKILSRKTFGVNLKNITFDNYLKDTHKDNKRGYKIANKNNLEFKIEDFNEENLNKFTYIYNKTMDKLNSIKYYYFNSDYFKSLINDNKNMFLASIYFNNSLIASCIIFKYNKFLHYHIGGSLVEYRNLRPNNLLHIKVIEYGIKNNYELYHLGGGLKDNDSLYNFKKKISNIEFDYCIYKNILNHEIYNKICKNYDVLDYFPIHRKND